LACSPRKESCRGFPGGADKDFPIRAIREIRGKESYDYASAALGNSRANDPDFKNISITMLHLLKFPVKNSKISCD
jgi:hypothetical protein